MVDLVCAPGIAGGPVAVLQPSDDPSNPGAFRDRRLRMLDSAHAMLVIRTAPSESGAYEIAYNVHAGPRIPVFFAVHRGCPMESTLLHDLAPLVDVRYVEFTRTVELAEELREFLAGCRRQPGPLPVAAAQARLSAAVRLLRTLSERSDRERIAMWWTARHAVEAAAAMLTAAQTPVGPHRLDLLRAALGTARAAVESGKMAIYQTVGSSSGGGTTGPRG
ncbi:hypothetical protein ACIHCQ_23050 [Streptomyces sp. NPDC052236]|uniref:hypothetical protein n=1 Tax=Streptomyces sp. NPDC052236 TaxID=3365686 RepID=UPI0037D16459